MPANPNFRLPVTASSSEEAIQLIRDGDPDLRFADLEARPVSAPADDADQATLPNSLRPTGPGPWEIYNRAAGHSVLNLISNGEPVTDRGTAQRLAMTRIGPEQFDNYGVRTRGTSGMSNVGTQTDMENRLGLPSQSANANYAVVDRQTLDPVFRFVATNRNEANRTYGAWLAAAGLPTTTEDFGFQEIRPQIPEVPMDVAQNFPQDRTDGRNTDYSFRDLFGTTDQASSAPPGNSFSGQWRVVLDGEEVWRFRGPANGGQADANRIAQLWLRDQRSQGLLSPAPGAEIEVVPVMMESVQQHVKPGMAEGLDPDKKYTIKKSYTMSKAGVEKSVWYIMDGDFVVDATDLRRDAKYYADKWNAAEKDSKGVAEGVYHGDWVRHPENQWKIGQIQSIDNGQAVVTWKKTDKRKKAMSSTHAVDALQHARREFSQLTQPTHTPGIAEDNALTEIEHMKQSHFTGGKDMLGSFQKPGKKHLKPLPGGTDLMYSVTKDNYGSYVYIVDPGVPGMTKHSIVASLSLIDSDLPNTFQVGSITVDEDYRGRGLARALYGIVLTIMRKNLVSGSSQTPGGRRNWLSLASIPGVEVKGLVTLSNRDTNTTVGDPKSRYNKYVEKTIDRVMELGGQFVSKGKNYNYWAFDVVPGKGQLQPAVQNALSKLYGYDSDALLMATWTGS